MEVHGTVDGYVLFCHLSTALKYFTCFWEQKQKKGSGRFSVYVVSFVEKNTGLLQAKHRAHDYTQITYSTQYATLIFITLPAAATYEVRTP